jgi:hypothetical protein
MANSHALAQEASELEVSCPSCGVKPGQSCVYRTDSSRKLTGSHRERRERFLKFADRERWSCSNEGCPGSRLAIDSKEMMSSKEGSCPICDHWIGDPASIMTLDELLRNMAPQLVETHELVENPDGPKTNMEIIERESGPTLIGYPDNKDAIFHLVPRTKPPEWNPLKEGPA